MTQTIHDFAEELLNELSGTHTIRENIQLIESKLTSWLTEGIGEEDNPKNPDWVDDIKTYNRNQLKQEQRQRFGITPKEQK